MGGRFWVRDKGAIGMEWSRGQLWACGEVAKGLFTPRTIKITSTRMIMTSMSVHTEERHLNDKILDLSANN